MLMRGWGSEHSSHSRRPAPDAGLGFSSSPSNFAEKQADFSLEERREEEIRTLADPARSDRKKHMRRPTERAAFFLIAIFLRVHP